MSIKYTIRNYKSGRLLEFKHKDGTSIYGTSLSDLYDTINSYNAIYYDKS